MLLDTYKVDYNSQNNDKTKVNPNDKSIDLNAESARKARERRKNLEWKQIPFNDLDILATQNADE